jgi:hypothetical protein
MYKGVGRPGNGRSRVLKLNRKRSCVAEKGKNIVGMQFTFLF